MKWIALGLAMGVVVAPSSAAATSCAPPPWVQLPLGSHFPADGFPVDAELWLPGPCGSTSGACSLVAADHTVELAIEARGEDACTGVYDYDSETHVYVLIMTPSEALLPDRAYALECENFGVDVEVVTRADTAPSLPPGEVTVSGARQSRIDASPSLCGCGDSSEDLILLAMGTLRDAYLREGGWIEAVYPSGRVFAITPSNLARSDEEVLLPYTSGPIELTPVAADGTRGETVTIEPDEIDEQAVYIPCRLSLGGPSRALWWLGPVLWIGWRRRRAP